MNQTSFIFDIIKGAEFSDCRKYRYRLWRIWDKSLPIAFFIGLNPSTADENIDDPTIRREINFAKAWGYGGLEKANLFAFRATNPKNMIMANDPIGQNNDMVLSYLHSKSAITIAAWGNNGGFKNRDKKVIQMLTSIKEINCLKITKSGYPSHPLYLKSDLRPMIYMPYPHKEKE
jgi:hypothetical protein